jgi:hypothetical protein
LSNVDHDGLLHDVGRDLVATLDITLLNGGSSDATVALGVVLFDIDLVVGRLLRRQKRLLVQLLGFGILVLILYL